MLISLFGFINIDINKFYVEINLEFVAHEFQLEILPENVSFPKSHNNERF